jgi:hypothetical protein
MISSERLTRAGKRTRGQIAPTILFKDAAQSSSYTIPDIYSQDSYVISNFFSEIRDAVQE